MKHFLHILLLLLVVCTASTLSVAAKTAPAAAYTFTLVIDAGHGGNDAGAKGAISYEKNINLNVALAFGRYVERNCSDVRVVYTRKTDIFIPLHERAAIANRNKADVFISIHTNALPNGRIARGLETYTMGMRRSNEKLSVAMRENSVITIEKDYREHYEGYDPNSPESTIMFEFINDKNMAQSVDLAKLVQSNVCAVTDRQNKGVKQDVFLVLRETSMPACLIELGFITTPDEEQYLNNKDNVERLAYGIYKAFVQYKNQQTGKQTAIAPPPATSNKSGANSTAAQAQQTTSQAQQTQTTSQTTSQSTAAKQQSQQQSVPNPNRPVFKIQIIAGSNAIKEGSALFKGLEGVECYTEGGLYKYTYGATTDYNEILRLRKQILDRFPEAFVIAFKNGEKMNVNQAIAEWKQR